MKKIIRLKCLTQVKNNKEQILESYDTLFKNLRSSTTVRAQDKSATQYPAMSIFTTNYDTCLEVYFNTRQVQQFSRGITEKFGEYLFDVEKFLKERKSIELIKLHGSVDLFTKEKRIRFLPGAGAIDTSAITYLGEEYGPEFMFYPVESSTATRLVQSPLIELFYVFRTRLQENNTWLITGSTFRDTTLTSIMNDVITQKSEDEYPTVIHINPSATQMNDYLSNKGYLALAQIIKTIDHPFIDETVVTELKQIKVS